MPLYSYLRELYISVIPYQIVECPLKPNKFAFIPQTKYEIRIWIVFWNISFWIWSDTMPSAFVMSKKKYASQSYILIDLYYSQNKRFSVRDFTMLLWLQCCDSDANDIIPDDNDRWLSLPVLVNIYTYM